MSAAKLPAVNEPVTAQPPQLYRGAETCDFAPIIGHPGYRVGCDGSVWSCWDKVSYGTRGFRSVMADRWHRLQIVSHNRSGHLRVELRGGRRVFVHRLVLEAFVGPCPVGMQGCHEDNDPTNNAVSNLRWDTPQSNEEDKRRHGTKAIGRRNGNARLTDELVLHIRAERETEGLSFAALGARHGIAPNTVRAVVLRWAWKHV